jgi:hypothetical protein
MRARPDPFAGAFLIIDRGGSQKMARGWESKSVESQIDDAGAAADRGEILTPEQREIQERRRGLELSRRRVLQEIETARSPVRRTSLQQALAFLDEEIRKLLPSGA